MIEDKSIDAIIHSTPTNWHASAPSGPCRRQRRLRREAASVTLWEGHKIVEAARKYNRIVQHGRNAAAAPKSWRPWTICTGAIGEIFMARGIGHKYRPGIGKVKPDNPPPTLNFDMWRGPAPMKPYSANQIHYNWHWFWDTGNGDLGNLGVHGLDVMRMAFGLDRFRTECSRWAAISSGRMPRKRRTTRPACSAMCKKSDAGVFDSQRLFELRSRYGRIYSLHAG